MKKNESVDAPTTLAEKAAVWWLIACLAIFGCIYFVAGVAFEVGVRSLDTLFFWRSARLKQ